MTPPRVVKGGRAVWTLGAKAAVAERKQKRRRRRNVGFIMIKVGYSKEKTSTKSSEKG
jgi:hypothetical protein